jgi:hypothetical protein
MYNKPLSRWLAAAKLSHRNTQLPGLISSPMVQSSCEVVISPSASAQSLQSSRRPEWLAVNPWMKGVHAALSYTAPWARGFVAP